MQGSSKVMAYLFDIWLQGAVERSGLHMLRNQSLLLQHIQGKALLHRSQVWVWGPASLCAKEEKCLSSQ